MSALTGAGIASYCSVADGNVSGTSTWAAISAAGYNDDTGSPTYYSLGSGTSYTNSPTFTGSSDTIDGIAIMISALGTITGTFTIGLDTAGSDVSGTIVTCNVSDLPKSGWVLFKFAAGVTLSSGTVYNVKYKSSTANTVVLCYNSYSTGYFARFLRTTTTGTAPSAGASQNDNLYAMGEITGVGTHNARTITWDIASVTYAYNSLFVGAYCTVSVQNSASTNYYIYLRNSCRVGGLGVLSMGISGTPIVSTSTSTLVFLGTAGQFGLFVQNGGTFNGYGQSKTPWASLTANAASAATSIAVGAATGWLVGDVLCFASTSLTYSEAESKTISSVSGTTIGVAALTYAHTGTGDYIGEVGNLTRNVVIRGTTSTLTAFIQCQLGSTYNAHYVEHVWLGGAPYTGVAAFTFVGSASAGLTFDIYGCSFHDTIGANVSGINFQIYATSGTPTLAESVFYNIQSTHFYNSSGNSSSKLTIDSCLFIYNQNANSNLVTLDLTNDLVVVFTNNRLASSNQNGLQIIGAGFLSTNLTMSNNTTHSNLGAGIDISLSSTVINYSILNIGSALTWRNVSGIQVSNFLVGSHLILSSWTSYANQYQQLNIIPSFSGIFEINSCVWKAGSTPATNKGMNFSASYVQSLQSMFFSNCDLGSLGSHTYGDIYATANNYSYLYFQNCLFSAIPITSVIQQLFLFYSAMTSTRHNQVNSDYKTWTNTGTISRDTTIYGTASPSVRLTPLSSTIPMTCGYFDVIVPSGATPTVSIKVRRSATGSGDAATHNGSYPQLYLANQPEAGVNGDTLLATATSSSNGAWQTLTATLPAPTGNAIMRMVVRATGTVGWVNVDDFQTTQTGADDTGLAFNFGGYPTTRLGSAGGVLPVTQVVPLIRKKVI